MTEVRIPLPGWIGSAVEATGPLVTDRDRMQAVIGLARRNVDEGTGGPFAAAVFESSTGRMVAAGVNVVVPSNAAVAHAEVMAVAAAGIRLGSFDLGALGRTELVASTEPCSMCLGATVWSGVSRLVCAARDEDATAIGFDEGPKPTDWAAELERRGISVARDVERSAARDVLRHYAAGGGVIYNGRHG